MEEPTHKKETTEHELLELMRKQEYRAQMRQEEAQNLKKWAAIVGFGGFNVLIFGQALVNNNNSSSDSASNGNWPIIFTGILASISLILWIAAKSREP